MNSQERVSRAALELFASKGFEATGIREIARDAGIGTASLYYYMGTKEALLETLVEEGMQSLISGAREATHDISDARYGLEGLVMHHVIYHGRNPLTASVIDTEVRALTGDRLRRIRERRNEYEDLWRGVIMRGLSEGVFNLADGGLTRLALLGMCNEIPRWYSPRGRCPLEEVARQYAAMAMRVVGAEKRKA